MKIKTESYLLIGSITVIPVLVCVILFFSGQIEEEKGNKGLYKTAQRYYQSLNTNDWSQFSIDRDLLDIYQPAIAIIGKDKHVLYSSISGVRAGSSFADAAWQLLSSSEPGLDNFIMTTKDFERKLPASFKSIPGYGTHEAILFVRIPAQTGFLSSSSSREIIIGGMIFLLMCIIAISIRIITTISSTLSLISHATENFRAGDYNREITVSGNDEICLLVAAFNRMRSEISENAQQKSHLIMGLSHDFKTPLTLIQGYREVIEKELAGRHERVGKYLNIISSKTEQLENMIDDLLDYISLDAGEWPYSFTPVPLAGWMGSFILRSKNDAALLGKTVTADVVLSPDVMVRMDEHLVERAFDNLVHNSLRYTGSDGIIHITSICTDSCVTISLSDNGPGIAKKDLPFIFDTFYRGSPSRQVPGMGLGLSVVKSVIEAHNWTISVESERNQGAVFIITIPLAVPQSSPPLRERAGRFLKK
jgi:signal transduction histidine kinase